ncbi:Putative uncharacterized protein [Thermobacillus xylanilyticus]|jgi:hypothetical protein|uniref:Uncharacterized protein n=2 Tax=Thermobacillus TaxID=76632 RepID=L0EEB2_THECK|nr:MULTISPECIES: hypothetical protein [Thermobacillus]AGA57485.1 hypothetical protein Theco_1320 [Thermobacillus composti KWC4]CAG5084342.1 Putative uncharacterized protein [Thermobacillus xylanilyticus]
MDVQDVLLFLFFSSLEWLALMVLTFAIFKFQLPGYWGRLLLSSFMLSLLSYMVLIELKLGVVASLIQVPIIFICFWQFFRIPVFYAGLMVVNGYVSYILIQAIIISVFQLTGIVIAPNVPEGFIVQILTSCIAFLLAWLLIRTNWGFTFVPDTDRVKVKWTKLNVRLLVMSIAGYAVLATCSYLFFSGYTPVLVLILGTVVFGFLQYLVFKREYNEHG